MGELLNGMTGWLTANPSWVAVAIFVVAFIECVAIVGIVVPGTVIMFAIAALAGSGILPLSEVLLLGFLADCWATQCRTSSAVASISESASYRGCAPIRNG